MSYISNANRPVATGPAGWLTRSSLTSARLTAADEALSGPQTTQPAAVPKTKEATIAGLLGVSAGRLAGLLASREPLVITLDDNGRMSLGPDPTESKIPLMPDGRLDVEAIEAAGGKVTGLLPPDGWSSLTVIADQATTHTAARVQLGDGSPPVIVRSLTISEAPSGPPKTTEFLYRMLHYLQKMPASVEEASRRHGENFFDFGGVGTPLVDIKL